MRRQASRELDDKANVAWDQLPTLVMRDSPKVQARFTRLAFIFAAVVIIADYAALGWATEPAREDASSQQAEKPRDSKHPFSIEQAHELLSDWQLESALEAGEALLAADPNNPEVWYLAGRIEHARGEHLAALALVRAAADAGLAEAAQFLPMVEHTAAYAAQFRTYETPHFSIRYLNKDEIVATYAAPVLEAAYANIGGDLELLPAERGEKIAVEIYPDARGLSGATGLSLREIETTGTIAVCKYHRLMVTSPLATTNGYSWGDTLAHEFTHLVISKKSRNTIPIWMHEGIAKYYESRWKGAAGLDLGPYSENLLADATRSGKFITFKQMHPSMAKLPSQKDAALAFAQVFTVIEFLREKYGPKAIAQVLEHAGQGLPLNVALQASFGLSMDGVENAWKRYVRKRQFRLVPGAAPERIQLASDEKQAQQEKPLEQIANRDAHGFSRLGELLQRDGRDHAAIIEYEKAFAIAGVKHITLVTRLAKAYQAVGRERDAVRVLEQALPAHPEDADAHLVAGRLELARGASKNARQHFEQVKLQNPFNPEVHLAFAKLFESEGKADEAARSKRFAELAVKPRPTRTYELPPARAGAGALNIVAPRWGRVRVDGADLATPAWNLALEPGTHTITYKRADGSTGESSVSVSAGPAKLVTLQ